MTKKTKEENNSTFKTSFGDEISVIPEFFNYHENTFGRHSGNPKKLYDHFLATSTNVSGGFEKLDKNKTFKQREHLNKVSFRKYTFTYMQVQLFLHLLTTYTNIPASFNRTLDIGCGTGIQPRLLKGLGITKETVGLDLFDRATQISDKSIRTQHLKLKFSRYLEPILSHIEKKPKQRQTDFEKALLRKISTPRRHLSSISSVNLPMSIYKQSLKQKTNFDDFIEGNVYEHSGKYDLITSFSSIEWFKLDEIMQKIDDLLEPNGIFYMYVGSWWYPANVSSIYGHFPYVAQRLNEKDFMRYIEQFHHDDAKYFETAYKYFDPQMPTMNDYIEAGLKNNLVPLHAVNIPIGGMFNRSRGITPIGYAEHCPEELQNVLKNINRFRPDIRMEDLFSGLYYIIFKKRDTQNLFSPELFKNKSEEINWSYRPKSKIGKKIRELGIRLTTKERP